MPRGCVLITLAAAVLLAASSGTALAQPPSIGFTPHTGTVNEGATADPDSEHPLLKVTVRAWGLPAGPAGRGADGQPTARQQAIDALGEITIETEGIGLRHAATVSPVYNTAAALDEDKVFAASDTFQLTATPVQDADSLNEEFTLQLRSTEGIQTGASFRGTVIDDDPLATATFSRTDIRVVEEATTQVSVRVAAPEGMDFPRFTNTQQHIVLRATPAAAVGTGPCPTAGESDFALRIWSQTERLAPGSRTGEITIEKRIADYERGAAALRLTACHDMSSFGDSQVTLAFKTSSLQTPAGGITAGPPAVIQILNGDPLPSVSLTSSAIAIDEGKTETVAIIAEGNLANAVMQVGVRVTGDALISLLQDGARLPARAGGSYTVDIGGNTSTVLTVRADEDGSLADGQTKTATVTIVDAGGADISDRDTLTVTVNGSTAVPALPLVGQLLLALLLMSGGVRLRARR